MGWTSKSLWFELNTAVLSFPTREETSVRPVSGRLSVNNAWVAHITCVSRGGNQLNHRSVAAADDWEKHTGKPAF